MVLAPKRSAVRRKGSAVPKNEESTKRYKSEVNLKKKVCGTEKKGVGEPSLTKRSEFGVNSEWGEKSGGVGDLAFVDPV